MFVKEFPNKGWSLSSLNKLLNKIDQTGTVDRKSGSGKKRTTRTVENVNAVEDLTLSQENAPGTHRTVRQIAREIGISRTSVHEIIAKDLKLVCFKKKRAQDLTVTNKLTRLVRAKQLLKKYPDTQFHSYGLPMKNFSLLLRQSISRMIAFMRHLERARNICPPNVSSKPVQTFRSQ